MNQAAGRDLVRAGHAPLGAGSIRLARTDSILSVVRGHVDLFAQAMTNDVAIGPRCHLFRVATGGLVFGLRQTRGRVAPAQRVTGTQRASTIVEIIAVTCRGGEVVPCPRSAVHDDQLSAWVLQLSAVAGDDFPCKDEAGAKLTKVERWQALGEFHRAVLDRIAQLAAADSIAAKDAIERRARETVGHLARVCSRLAEIVLPRSRTDEPALDAHTDPLLSTHAIIAASIGATVRTPVARDPTDNSHSAIAEIARLSRLRVRRVNLRGDWWHRDHGALLAWRGETRRPVALLPIATRRWHAVDATTGESRRVDAKLAAELATDAVMFYRSLPAVQPSLRGCAIFALRQGRGDVRRFLLGGLSLGLLALAMPIASGIIIDSIIPEAAGTQLAFCVAGLLMASIGTLAFQLMQNIAILRLESQVDATLQAAIVDRILRLPTAFFRRYPKGELADRTLAVQAMRRALAGRLIQLMASLFALFNLVLMVWYDAVLGWTAVCFTLIRVSVIARMTMLRLKLEVPLADLDGKLNGLLLQLVVGLGKLKVAGATGRAIDCWSKIFVVQKRLTFASQRMAKGQAVIDTVLALAAALAIFALIKLPPNDPGRDLGRMVAFLTAFGLSSMAVSNLAAVIGESLIAVPNWNRLKPMLAEPLESTPEAEQPGVLSGRIEFRNVTFRYLENDPPTIDAVSFTANEGECIAIVGPSGSGKSTLFRLLLGFETPEQGRIFVDGKSIDRLDISALRQRFGVVLQQTDRLGTTIYDTICGGGGLPLNRAWEAARLAGVADDIEAMPMGMQTVLTGSISALSGGQRQRLMIARALVHRPRVLLFDEATSALDNGTQKTVSAALAAIKATRLIVAHRLSTVQTADKIIVLSGGRIIQQGTFDELAGQSGTFAELIHRQLL
jgi:NHLM bacteriocin system ABC transporter ATP-binding protein